MNAPTTTAPRALCPTCGRLGDGRQLSEYPAGVPRAEYLCETGEHLWITTWFGGAA